MKKACAQIVSKRMPVLLLIVAVLMSSGSAALVRKTITYQSSISVDSNGPLDLNAELNYDSMRNGSPIAVVMHGYSPTSTFAEFRPAALRLRDKGFFTILVAMRGRDGSDGLRDSGGVEIFDIYDAVEKVKAAYPQLVNPEIVYITGYSGGGGNTMSALTKFPDTFRAGAGYFGMSDYGYDPDDSWYFYGAASSHQQLMNADIGNPTTGDPRVLDRYLARASNLASLNNPYSEIHLFVNYNEPICPVVNSTSYRDNAVAAESYPGEFSNITVHIGGQGQYEDFDGDGINDPEELQNWPHQLPTASQQYAAEAWFLDRLLAGEIPQPVMNDQDTLFVAGYVKTKPFFLWLGDGQNAAAQLHYSLSETEKTFEISLLSSDHAISGRLEINVADMAGASVSVLLNGVAIDQFTAVDRYTHPTLRHGDTLVLRAGLGEKSPDLNGDSVVDLVDFCIFSYEWGMNHVDHPSDLNRDGIVDTVDLEMFVDHWFKGKYLRLYGAAMDSDPEWSREGLWAFGQPSGQGGSQHGNCDPSTGFTGLNVMGVNLDGDYEPAVSGPYCLTLGPVDCRGFEKLSLKFARWLNSDEPYYVDSRIEWSANGTDWQTLWRHEGTNPMTDNSWTPVNYGLPAAADDQQTLYIRWSYEILNPRVWPYSGWNLDDVEIWGKCLN